MAKEASQSRCLKRDLNDKEKADKKHFREKEQCKDSWAFLRTRRANGSGSRAIRRVTGSREKPGRQTGGRTGRVGSFIYSADNGSHWEQNLVSQDFLARVTLREMHGREARRGQGTSQGLERSDKQCWVGSDGRGETGTARKS